MGTLGFALGGTLQKMDNTTPESIHLQRCLRAMVDGGQRAAVLEVSSHGLVLQRVSGISFAAAVFTNLTRDHLDFHGSEEAYFAAKAQLFEALGEDAVAVLNADDPMSSELERRTRAAVLTYGRDRAAQVHLSEVTTDREGMRLQVEVPNGHLEVRTVLTGDFNCYNVLAALATGLALGLDAEAICAGIASADSVPGRFERIVAGQEFEVIVDYAHTPDALARVLRSARDLTEGRLICLFGCGGDRDRGKRPEMGRVASELADLVWVTSDNPRSEEPGGILDEIVVGMGPQVVVEREVDRGQAIESALRAACPGDVVLVAGKGHEAEQILANRTITFDDRVVVRAVLRGLNGAN
jgi:UDP-N-acetylmuramoyl-L-alanyl-D-glutamate--2,6-diaminopimelate ligase